MFKLIIKHDDYIINFKHNEIIKVGWTYFIFKLS
jgi:hypothetical protein